jgi:hypothetical protein
VSRTNGAVERQDGRCEERADEIHRVSDTVERGTSQPTGIKQLQIYANIISIIFVNCCVKGDVTGTV